MFLFLKGVQVPTVDFVVLVPTQRADFKVFLWSNLELELCESLNIPIFPNIPFFSLCSLFSADFQSSLKFL